MPIVGKKKNELKNQKANGTDNNIIEEQSTPDNVLLIRTITN